MCSVKSLRQCSNTNRERERVKDRRAHTRTHAHTHTPDCLTNSTHFRKESRSWQAVNLCMRTLAFLDNASFWATTSKKARVVKRETKRVGDVGERVRARERTACTQTQKETQSVIKACDPCGSLCRICQSMSAPIGNTICGC